MTASQNQILAETHNPAARAELIAMFEAQDRANAEARKRNEARRESERKALEAKGREQRIKAGMPLPDDLPAADFEAHLERQRLIAELARQKVLAGHYADVWGVDRARELAEARAAAGRAAAQAEADQTLQAAIDERNAARAAMVTGSADAGESADAPQRGA